MAISDTGSESSNGEDEPFDPADLVSRKPSALPEIYEYAFDHERVTPKAVREGVAVSKSVAHANLTRLCDVGLLERVDRGVYVTSTIALDPDCVYTLGELRSREQFEICRLATDTTDLDVPTLSEEIRMAPSNVRNAARRLEEGDFLEIRRRSYENSKKRYRLSEQGARALASLDADRYRGRDGRRTVAHATGIEGTSFRTAYEVEDAHYLAESADEWLHPRQVASALEKDPKQSQRRFSKMAKRGLLDRNAEDTKLIIDPTEGAVTLFDELELYAISTRFGIDLYSIAMTESAPERFSNDDLYTSLVDNGDEVSVRELNRARNASKRAGLLEGDSMTGYAFTIGHR